MDAKAWSLWNLAGNLSAWGPEVFFRLKNPFKMEFKVGAAGSICGSLHLVLDNPGQIIQEAEGS